MANADTMGRTEVRVYLLLRDQDSDTWLTASEITKRLEVAPRTVQRCLSRLVPDVVERQETRPAPRYRVHFWKGDYGKGPKGRARARQLNAAANAFGV